MRNLENQSPWVSINLSCSKHLCAVPERQANGVRSALGSSKVVARLLTPHMQCTLICCASWAARHSASADPAVLCNGKVQPRTRSLSCGSVAPQPCGRCGRRQQRCDEAETVMSCYQPAAQEILSETLNKIGSPATRTLTLPLPLPLRFSIFFKGLWRQARSTRTAFPTLFVPLDHCDFGVPLLRPPDIVAAIGAAHVRRAQCVASLPATGTPM